MKLKETKKLFQGTYSYKLVVVTPFASKFRSRNLDNIFAYPQTAWYRPSDFEHVKKVINHLKKIENYSLRVEHPWLSIYSNSRQDLLALANIDKAYIKYFYEPSVDLMPNQIVMHDMPYHFKVTVGIGNNNLSSFIDWAKDNENFRIPRWSREQLSRDRRYVQSYFYAKDQSNLLLAKIHLGSSIHKIETIVNKDQTKAQMYDPKYDK